MLSNLTQKNNWWIQVSEVSVFALKWYSNLFEGPREWPWLATMAIYSPNKPIQPLPLRAALCGGDMFGAP